MKASSTLLDQTCIYELDRRCGDALKGAVLTPLLGPVGEWDANLFLPKSGLEGITVMEQIHEQSNAEASPYPLIFCRQPHGKPEQWAFDTGGSWKDAAGGWEQAGSSCWNVRVDGFVCKVGERLRRPHGEAGSLFPPPS